MRRALVVVAAAGLGLMLSSTIASSQPAAVAIDTRSPSLDKNGEGGWTVSLGFTNLTEEEVTIAAQTKRGDDEGCELTLNPDELPEAEHIDVSVGVPAGCEVRDDGIDFSIQAMAGTNSVATFDINAAPKPDDAEPEWAALLAFPIALATMFVVLAGLYLVWDSVDRSNHRITQPLEHLEASWSFKDSWVSNVTVVGGLLTGVFGSSDVVKSLLGEDAGSSIALATVGAAIALIFVGAGPIVLLAAKSRRHNAITVFGLLAASAVTLAGAFGELWVVYRTGRELDLGGWQKWLWIPTAMATALLATYAIRTIVDALERGTTRPRKPAASDTIVAATMIVEAMKANSNIDANEVNANLEKLAKRYPTAGTSPGDDYPTPRRTAVL